MNDEQQDALIEQSQKNGVKAVRTGNEDPAGIFRCGGLTKAGKLALSPM